MVKKKSKKIKKFAVTLFAASVIILFVLIYFVPNFGDTFQRTRIATYDTIQIIDNIEGYVIRDESVVFSNIGGEIHYNVSDGENVKKGSEILRVNIQPIDPKTESKLEVINQRIESINSGGSIFENDIEKIEAQIKVYINDIRIAKDDGNLSEVRKISDKIDRLTDKKDIILKNTGLNSSSIENLEAERGQLQNIIDQSVVSFKTNNSGVISYYIDGYESEFTPLSMYLLKKDALAKMDVEAQDIYREKTFANEPLFKIINSSEWYVVTWVNNNRINNYKKGNTVYLNLPYKQTEGIIYDIIKDNENENLVIIQLDHYYPEFWKLRKIDTEIIVANYEGLSIDNDSIVEKDGQAGVYIIDIDGQHTFRPIKIVGSDDKKTIVESGYYYIQKENGSEKIKTIDLYDEILRNANKKIKS
ncbi:MAG: hypothetical protein GX285_09310 [Clostridiales bacterium]|nr:hypothetical protein [Clostridiales bacterium]